MKDLLRQKTSLSEEIETILNEQIRQEGYASALYLSMASWCDRNGLIKSASFLFRQSDEERKHMLKIFNYMCDVGGKAISPEISNIPQEFDSFRSIFEMGLEQEIANTQSFHRIIDKCHKLKDYTTVEFLQWFIDEQVEEEYIFRRALELFDVIGEEGVGRYLIDKKIAKIKYKKQ